MIFTITVEINVCTVYVLHTHVPFIHDCNTCHLILQTATPGEMGLCALSPRLDKPTRIVDLEEILFSVVKNDHLNLAQRQCVGRSIYLEVKFIFDYTFICGEKYLPRGLYS